MARTGQPEHSLTPRPTAEAGTLQEASANQMIARHLKVCSGCRAVFESDPNQEDANLLFRKFHNQRREDG
jgi:predicted anti-sigma-YlaC factor YlaD